MHKNIYKYSWTQSTRNLKTVIKYVKIKQETFIKIEDVRVLKGICDVSDHHIKYLFQCNITTKK